MKWRLLTAATVVALTAGAFGAAGTAHADPAPWTDPHHPDYNDFSCAGGYFVYVCDGEHYPDGSYWRQVLPVPFRQGFMQCMDADNQPAAPGGCGGEFKG